MRISGGKFGGRTLAVPKTGDIRPTQDRVREALFSMLMAEVPGSRFLDLFAGTGSVGIEALSRGAAHAAFVERNPRHAAVLSRNLGILFPSAPERPFEVRTAEAYSFIASYSGDGFDIVFADPPYALGEEKGYASVLSTLAERGVVRSGGVFVAEMTAHQPADSIPGWQLLRDRTYGKTRICLWRREV